MSRLRYPVRDAQEQIGVKNTKFWKLVDAGELEVHYDGNRAYCTHETLANYVQRSQKNIAPPDYKPRAKPGTFGVQSAKANK
jgi:hypothetical protein